MQLLETQRLILRKWKVSDLLSLYRINSDPKVMEFFPNRLTREESDRFAKEIQYKIKENGWGFWAIEEKQSSQFIGFVGLNKPRIDLPFTPCIEIAWRLDSYYWNKGYATEAAKRSLEYAFTTLCINEVVSFTALINKRSEKVMQKIGMIDTQNNFFHPKVPSNSLLSEHVLYKITKEQWYNNK